MLWNFSVNYHMLIVIVDPWIGKFYMTKSDIGFLLTKVVEGSSSVIVVIPIINHGSDAPKSTTKISKVSSE